MNRSSGSPSAAPDAASADWGFLSLPETGPEAQRLYDDDLDELGYVTNVSRLWAHQPAQNEILFGLLEHAADSAGLSLRDRGVLIAACASTIGDSYCSFAWGTKLAEEAGAELAAAILAGKDEPLDRREAALARWARQVARDPNGTSPGDLQPLREAGFEDAQILAVTLFLGLRIAFSTVNDALGARPDGQLARSAPAAVRRVVSYGRPAAPQRGES